MVIGKIDWFGGLNRKTNKINNFGFIVPHSGDDSEKFFVHRNDIPTTLQDILEGKNGEGVYVQFDIETGSKGKQATNIKLLTYIGITGLVKRGRVCITCEDHYPVYFTSYEKVCFGEILHFGIRYNPSLKVDEAILVKKFNKLNSERELVERAAKSNNYKIFNQFWIEYLQTIPVEQGVAFALEKIQMVDSCKQEVLIRELMHNLDNFFVASAELRSFLKSSQYNSYSHHYFIDKYLDLVDEPLRQELIDELIARLKKASDSERSIYWNKVKYLKQNLKYKGFLWDIAPAESKRLLIQDRYRKFFELVSLFKDSEYPYAQSISGDWRELYKLDEIDKTLINKWTSYEPKSSFKIAQMISARGAEKLVINYYKSLGCTVEDISAHQVNQKIQDWKKYDVRLDSKFLLDVKNARISVNSNTYSEFCVPAFKQVRGNYVNIVGVLSPYLRQEDMHDNSLLKIHVSAPRVLGTFNPTEIRKLEENYSDHLIKINMSRGFDPKNYFPHWLFDYGPRFYVKQGNVVERFKALKDVEIPTWEDISTIGSQNLIPLFIAAKRKVPQDWLDSFPTWKVKFINSLIELPKDHISLPYVFLSLLKHFLSMLSYKGSDYSPLEYQKILYTTCETKHPLKIYDPLDTIKDFCDTLQSLWEHRNNANLTKFRIFKFNGRGLLKGKRSEADNQETTILAYCGGWIEKIGKCGCTPLVIGKHETCSTCGRLVCPKPNCRYCSDECRSMVKEEQNEED